MFAPYCPVTCGTCKKGYSVYIDGQLRAGIPYSGAGWDNMMYRYRGGMGWLPGGLGYQVCLYTTEEDR